jgi:hypothetical protein
MRAGRAYGEERGATPNEDDGLAARVPEQRNPVGESLDRNAFTEVRSLKLARVVRQEAKF